MSVELAERAANWLEANPEAALVKRVACAAVVVSGGDLHGTADCDEMADMLGESTGDVMIAVAWIYEARGL